MRAVRDVSGMMVDVSARSRERARDLLIRAAEQLMAERGIEGADLKDIQRAAGQRNRSAVNYYFKDRFPTRSGHRDAALNRPRVDVRWTAHADPARGLVTKAGAKQAGATCGVRARPRWCSDLDPVVLDTSGRCFL